MMAGKENTGVRRIVLAAGYSLQGLKTAWLKEAAFRQELLLVIILLPLGMWLGSNSIERALLVSTCMIVLITELLNSAVEAVVDRISQEHHSLSGAAKDLGSAAVFVSLIMTVTVWSIVLYDRFI